MLRISGSVPALVTPFRSGRVDEPALARLVDWQISEGSSALLPCGTTGESATLTIEEHNHVISLVVQATRGRVPVVAGCGSNNTEVSLRHIEHAAEAGADAALVICPYYNKPGQRGLFAHFEYLAKNGPLPIIIYNNPGRTSIDMSSETLAELAALPNIIGVKESTGDINRVSEIRHLCGPDFLILSGNDYMNLGVMAHGGVGAFSVTANVAPRASAEMIAACARGDYETALRYQDRLWPLHRALFADASPGPVKYALAKTGMITGETRLPILPPSEEARRAVDEALIHAKITS